MDFKISVKEGKDCQKILSVEVGEEPIREEYEQFYKSVAPKAKIPGFRPGKASREVLEMYFKDEAKQEVIKHLVSESYTQAIREKVLEPLGYPDIKDVQFDGRKLSYQAVIETRPKIKLAKLSGFKIKKEAAQVEARDLEEALKRLQESLAKYNAVEGRPAAMGDFVVADYVCWVDGKEAEKRSEDWFEIKEDEFLKGFSVQLIGVQPGEQKEVRILFPENFSRKEWVGKEALFRVTVKEIKTKTLPPLDDELAKEAGEYKTLEELRQKIRADLQAQKDREKESEYEKALLDELLKNNKIDLPPGMVKKRQNYLVEETLERSKRHGLPEEKAEEFKKKIEEESQKEAVRQVHLAFLLDEIAVKENLTATEEDLKKKFEILTERFRQPLETIEKYYREHEDAKESLCDQIRSEKAIEFLKRNHQS